MAYFWQYILQWVYDWCKILILCFSKTILWYFHVIDFWSGLILKWRSCDPTGEALISTTTAMLCIRKSRSPTQLYTFNLGKFHMVWYEHEKSSKCTIFTVNCILLHFIAWKNIILNEVLRIVYSFIQSQIFKSK